jgi:hypothetical protein
VPGSPAGRPKSGISNGNGASNGNSNSNGNASPKITNGSNGANLKPSRLIIMDTVLPTPGSVPAPEESLLRVRDLTMIQAFNSHEREMDDWKRLFDTVSREENASCPAAQAGRLQLKNVAKPFGSVMSIMELEWVTGPAASAAATALASAPMSASAKTVVTPAAEEKEKSVGPQIKREPGAPSPGRLGATCGSGRNSPARGLGLSMNGRMPGMVNGNGSVHGNLNGVKTNGIKMG